MKIVVFPHDKARGPPGPGLNMEEHGVKFSQAAAAPADGELCKMTQEPAGAANR